MPSGRSRKQRGGARDHLNGSGYTPDITSADEMMEKTTFYYVSSHGQTILNLFCIVPENTFVIFAGSAGYVTFAAVKRAHHELGRMNLDRLLSADVEEGATPADKLAAYNSNLYRNFFEGNYNLFRMYPGMQIFCPGDIIQNNDLRFTVSANGGVSQRGVYALPVPKEDMVKMAIPDTIGIESDPLILIAKYFDTDPEMQEAYTLAGFKYPDLFAAIQALPTDEERYSRIKSYVTEIRGSFTRNYAKTFFTAPSALSKIFTKYAYNKPNNELITQDIQGSPFDYDENTKALRLDEILTRIAPKDRKKYTFIIVGGCRSPMSIFSDIEEPGPPNANIPFMSHRTLPPAAEPERRMARRLSFVAKEIPEECAIGKLPAFNLGKLKELFNNKEGFNRAVNSLFQFRINKRDRLFAAAGNNQAARQEALRKSFDPIEILLTDYRTRLFIGNPSYNSIQYKPTILVSDLPKILNILLQPSDYLASEDPAHKVGRDYCREIVNEMRLVFGKYMFELREGDPTQLAQQKTIGKLLLEFLYGNVGFFRNFRNANEANHAEMAEEEARIVAPYRNLREQVMKREAAEAEEVAKVKRIHQLRSYFSIQKHRLDANFISIKYYLQNSILFFNGLDSSIQKNARNTLTLEESLKRDQKHLQNLGNGTTYGAVYQEFTESHTDPGWITGFKSRLEAFKILFAELPEAVEFVKPYEKMIVDFEKQMKLYDQMKRFLEGRVGELSLAIQEEKDAAAAANARNAVAGAPAVPKRFYNELAAQVAAYTAAHPPAAPLRYNNVLAAQGAASKAAQPPAAPLRYNNVLAAQIAANVAGQGNKKPVGTHKKHHKRHGKGKASRPALGSQSKGRGGHRRTRKISRRY